MKRKPTDEQKAAAERERRQSQFSKADAYIVQAMANLASVEEGVLVGEERRRLDSAYGNLRLLREAIAERRKREGL